MEIFNIHIFEFLLIAALGLVVFGPERLPEVGRFLGRQLAKLLAWQQQSPELQMLNDVRSEFEREIASLRDELVRTRNQLDVSRSVSMESFREELKPMLSLREELDSALKVTRAAPAAAGDAKATVEEPAIATPHPTPAPAGDSPAAPNPGAEAPELFEPAGAGDAPVAALPEPTPVEPTAAAQTVPASIRPNKLAAARPASVFNQSPVESPPPNPNVAAPLALSDDERFQIEERLLRLVSQLQSLVGELQDRGLLGSEWQPQSSIISQEAVSRDHREGSAHNGR